MMVLDRRSGGFEDSRFARLPEFLRAGDVLVINDTRVMKARMYGVLERSAGTVREIEILFAGVVRENTWEVMCRPGRRVRPGDRVVLGNGEAIGTFGEPLAHGMRELAMTGEPVTSLMERLGHVPLPPYIERPDTKTDTTEYQTMFAAHPGAVAAPTAGLHFTPAVLTALKDNGIEVVSITLHVGVGTFLPVRQDDPRNHHLKPEQFSISEAVALRIREAQRVIAVGTTSARTLEYVAWKYGQVEAAAGFADTYILPGYEFRVVSGLLTNFHLPRSTLLMLVSAFASRQRILEAYAHAVASRYRFYSYGDCMLIT